MYGVCVVQKNSAMLLVIMKHKFVNNMLEYSARERSWEWARWTLWQKGSDDEADMLHSFVK